MQTSCKAACLCTYSLFFYSALPFLPFLTFELLQAPERSQLLLGQEVSSFPFSPVCSHTQTAAHVNPPSNCILLGRGPVFCQHRHPGRRFNMCLPARVCLIAVLDNDVVLNHVPKCFSEWRPVLAPCGLCCRWWMRHPSPV